MEVAQFLRDRVAGEEISGNNGYRRSPVSFLRPQTPQERQAVCQRHAQVDEDGVGVGGVYSIQSSFCVRRRQHVVSFEPEHPVEGIEYGFIIVNDQKEGQE